MPELAERPGAEFHNVPSIPPRVSTRSSASLGEADDHPSRPAGRTSRAGEVEDADGSCDRRRCHPRHDLVPLDATPRGGFHAAVTETSTLRRRRSAHGLDEQTTLSTCSRSRGSPRCSSRAPAVSRRGLLAGLQHYDDDGRLSRSACSRPTRCALGVRRHHPDAQYLHQHFHRRDRLDATPKPSPAVAGPAACRPGLPGRRPRIGRMQATSPTSPPTPTRPPPWR